MSYRLPAEWEPHTAVWLAWPHDEITFSGRLAKVEQDFVKIISAIHQSEQVELIVLDEPMKVRASEMLSRAGVILGKVNFRMTHYVDGWMRDCSPLFVRDDKNELVATNWRFNAWGSKFPDLLPDAALPEKIAKWLELPIRKADLVLEGGAIEVNGEGVCLTTEQCLLNPNRNPGKSHEDIEKYLQDFLGIEKTIWLKEGIAGDHTDGHIDEVARFVGKNKVVSSYEDNENDPNYEILKSAYEELAKHFEVIKLPMPHMQYDDGSRSPVSYTNFYIGNTVILAAVFGDPRDAEALEILALQFPGRQIIPIDCRDIIYGGGAVHCLLMQQPKVVDK